MYLVCDKNLFSVILTVFDCVQFSKSVICDVILILCDLWPDPDPALAPNH